MRFLCRALKKNDPYPKISILQAMKILTDSQEAVTNGTVINYLKKAGINSDVQQAAITDQEIPLKIFKKI